MKRKLLAIIILLSLSFVFAQSSVQTVYVTANGKKYHTQYCRTIKNSTVTAMDKQKAVNAGYTACKVCKP